MITASLPALRKTRFVNQSSPSRQKFEKLTSKVFDLQNQNQAQKCCSVCVMRISFLKIEVQGSLGRTCAPLYQALGSPSVPSSSFARAS